MVSQPTVHAFLNPRIGRSNVQTLQAILHLLMEGDHNASRDASVMLAARVEMCVNTGEDDELAFVLKALHALLAVVPFRRACARNEQLLFHTCRLHEKHHLSWAMRLDGVSALNFSAKVPANTLQQRNAIMLQFDRLVGAGGGAGGGGVELDTARTGDDETYRSDLTSARINTVGTQPSSARVVPRPAHAPMPSYSPSTEYSSLSARAHVDSCHLGGQLGDGERSPRTSPRSPRTVTPSRMPSAITSPAGGDFASAMGGSRLGGSRHINTDMLGVSRTPSNIPKLQVRNERLIEQGTTVLIF